MSALNRRQLLGPQKKQIAKNLGFKPDQNIRAVSPLARKIASQVNEGAQPADASLQYIAARAAALEVSTRVRDKVLLTIDQIAEGDVPKPEKEVLAETVRVQLYKGFGVARDVLRDDSLPLQAMWAHANVEKLRTDPTAVLARVPVDTSLYIDALRYGAFVRPGIVAKKHGVSAPTPSNPIYMLPADAWKEFKGHLKSAKPEKSKSHCGEKEW